MGDSNVGMGQYHHTGHYSARLLYFFSGSLFFTEPPRTGEAKTEARTSRLTGNCRIGTHVVLIKTVFWADEDVAGSSVRVLYG